MAALTTGLVVAGAGIYGANKQAGAAKDAANKQAKGVANAQVIQKEYTDKAVNQLVPLYGQARDAITAGNQQGGVLLDEAGNIISQGYDQSRNDLNTGFNKAQATFQPALQQGQQSQQVQAALSGALGPQAQKEAYANFNASPGQSYLQNQGEQSILRNAAALGGGLGAQPEVMQALQENAIGLAQQDFGNSFNRLSQISSRGDQAAGSIANLQTSLAQLLAGNSVNKAGALSGVTTDKANMAANTQQQIAQLLANQGNAVSNAYMGAGSEQTQLAQNLGQAKSAYNVYQANNANPLMQGIASGVGAYTGAGGTFGNPANLFSGSGGAGATQGGYTGNAYQNWLKTQGY